MKKIVGLLLLGVLFAACDDDDDDDNVAIRLSSKVETKALQDDQIAAGQELSFLRPKPVV